MLQRSPVYTIKVRRHQDNVIIPVVQRPKISNPFKYAGIYPPIKAQGRRKIAAFDELGPARDTPTPFEEMSSCTAVWYLFLVVFWGNSLDVTGR